MKQTRTEYFICKDNLKFLGRPNELEDYPVVTQLNFAKKYIDKTLAAIFLLDHKFLIEKGFNIKPITVTYEW